MKTLIVVVLLAAALYMVWPASEQKAIEPVSVILLQDMSESAPRNGCPLLSEEDFEKLAALISKTGGDLGFGVISDVDEPLARLQLSPIANPYQKARMRTQAQSFRRQVVDRLSRPLSRRTDLAAAMERANTFLGEASGKNRYLILVSDGEHDANRRRPAPPLSGVETLVVGGRVRPQLPNARYFESIGAAIHFINKTVEDSK